MIVVNPIQTWRAVKNLAILTTFVVFCILDVGELRAETVPGTTDASFSVSPDGNSSYSVPLMVPPGTAGVEPKLTLAYSSQGGPSPYGFGWSLSGLSQIQRGPKNVTDDGVVDGVKLLATDAFYLDGGKLVEVESELTGVREFRTRIESYSRVRAYEWSEHGPAYFVVETRAGLTMTYGKTLRTRVGIGADKRTLTWLLEEVEDRSGNYMAFTYQSASLGGPQSLDYVIHTVRYTGNKTQGLTPYAKIRFEFKSLSDDEVYGQRYVMGEPVTMRRKLDFIESSYKGDVLRRYKPNYRVPSNSDRFFTIESLHEHAGELSYKPLKFSYPESDPAWIDSDLMQGIEDLPDLSEVVGNVPQAYRYAQLPKGNQIVASILVATNAANKSVSEAFLYDSSQGVWEKDTKFRPPVDFAFTEGINRSVLIADVDHDGDDDLVVGTEASPDPARTYLANGNGWREVDAFPVDIRSPTLEDNGLLFVHVVDRNGATQRAVAWDHVDPLTGRRKRDVRRWDGSRWANVRRYRPPVSFSRTGSRALSGVRSIDVDCDGTEELVYFRVVGQAQATTVYRATDRGWRIEANPAFQIVIPAMPSDAALKVADINADGCADIVYSFDDGTGLVNGVRLASAGGWVESMRNFQNVAFWRASGAGHDRVAGDLIDIDGDSRPDLVEGTLGEFRTYRAFGNNWIADTKLNPPGPLGETKEDRSLTSKRVRLAGQGGWVWLNLRPREGLLVPDVWRYDPLLGWEDEAELEPPVDIAKFDKVDLGIRFTDVNNDGLSDIIWSMRKKKNNRLDRGAYIFRPGSGSSWTKDERFLLPVEISREDFRASGTMMVDVNGDGVVDILHARTSTNRGRPIETREAYINCSNLPRCANVPEGTVSGYWLKASQTDDLKGLVPPDIFASHNVGDLGFQVLDINGDGLTDIVSARDVEKWRDQDGSEVPADTPNSVVSYEVKAKTWLNQEGMRWTESDEFKLPVSLVRPVIRPLNGIGVGDEEQIPGIKTIATGAQLIDLNADRLPDLIYRFEAFRKIQSDSGQVSLESAPLQGVYMGSASGWKTNAAAFMPPSRLDDDPSADKRQFLFEDLNNDGNIDLVFAEKGKSRSYLNTGKGWSQPSAGYAIPDKAIRKGKGDQGFRLLDLNADMLPDIVFHWTKKKKGEREKGAFINTGTGWIAGNAGNAPDIPFAEYKLGDTGVRPLDVDGDGLLDIVQSFRRSKNDQQKRVQINTSPRPYLLTTTTNGVGSTITIRYQSFLADEAEPVANGADAVPSSTSSIAVSHQSHSPYPVVDAPLPGFLVQAVSSEGPGVARRTTTYKYGNYRTDIRSGRSLGFAITETYDVERRRRTVSTFLQEDGLLGSPKQSETYQYVEAAAAEVLISRSDSIWNITRKPGKAVPSLAGGITPEILVPNLGKSENESFDLEGVLLAGQTAHFEYDGFGNAKVVETIYADGSGTKTVNTYEDDVDRWLLARLRTATVKHYAPGLPEDVRRASFTYHPVSGLLRSETAFAGTTKELVTTYERDRFGNKSGSISAKPDGSMDRKQSVLFDAEGRFVNSIINALGHRSHTRYEAKSGVVLRQTDPNGVSESFTYDALQRLQSRMSPTGVVTTIRVEASDRRGTALLTREKSASFPETRSYSDAAGRTVRVEKKGWGNRTVVVDSSYDPLGRPRTTSLPYFDGDRAYYSSREYDLLDRVIEIGRPDGQISTKTYSGRTTVSTGVTGQTSTTKTDLRGRVWQTLDNIGGATTFEFDASGRTIKTTNAIGQAITQVYNEAGNRISLDDPSSGSWTYQYDVYGNLVFQKDPRGVETRLEYDGLNRQRKRTVVQNTAGEQHGPQVDVASWVYDEGPNAIGKLVSNEWGEGDIRTFEYDGFGRPKSQREQIGPDSLTIQDKLDAYGRLELRKYDTGVHLAHKYDSLGHLTSVVLRDGTLKRTVYRLLEVDAQGRVTREQTGAGIVTNNQYDHARGHLKESLTSAGGNTIQKLSLDYDLIGNLTSMADSAVGEINTYGFDGLNRIQRATLSSREEVLVTYDAIGNIKTKSDVGTYSYCDYGNLKQVLCDIADAGSAMSFEYDDAGNTIRSGNRLVTFGLRGKVTKIQGQSGTPLAGTRSKFHYDGDGALVSQSSLYKPKQHRYSSSFFSGVQVIRENYAPPDKKLPSERTILRHALSSASGVIGYYDKIFRHFPLRFAAPTYGQIMTMKPERVTDLRYGFSYMVKDHLGSIRAMVDETGKVLDRFRYDPWGKRIESEGYRYRKVKEGFTGHLMLDNLGLIHMGGRVYDPQLGRFMSPDPFIQAPFYSQSYNRYSYVLNNPLGFTDPTGYLIGSIGRALGGVVRGIARGFSRAIDAVVGKPLAWIGEQLNKGGRWLRRNWRTVAIIGLSVFLPGSGTLIAVMLKGAAIGGISAALYGGGPDEILKGALIGGVSAGAFYGAGVGIDKYKLNDFQAASLHGAIGGIESVARGGRFETGFMSTFATKSLTPHTRGMESRSGRVAAAAIAGGVTAKIGGGSFENGAVTGAFSQLFNGEETRIRREKAEAQSFADWWDSMTGGEPFFEYEFSHEGSVEWDLSKTISGSLSQDNSFSYRTDTPIFLEGGTDGTVMVGVQYGNPKRFFGASAGAFYNAERGIGASFEGTAGPLRIKSQPQVNVRYGRGSSSFWRKFQRQVNCGLSGGAICQ